MISNVIKAIPCATATTTRGFTRRLITPPRKSEVPQTTLASSAGTAVMAREPMGAHARDRWSARRWSCRPDPTYAARVVGKDPRAELPANFAAAVASLRPVRLRAEIRLSEAPAPQRLAPFAVALTADVAGDDGDDIVTGRFVVLHDPAGQEAWHGTTRIVAYVRAELEPEMANDPFLADVAWTWLTEGLNRRLPEDGFRAVGGTVTRVTSECYGTMASRAIVAHVELRVSWTPDTEDLGGHLEAWADVLAAAAGLAPLPPGVAALPSRRR